MNMKYVIVLVITITAITEGAEYTVGDDMGWMIPPSPDYYASWAAKYYFVENDTLVFNFEEGVHDITVLTKEDFNTCNTTNPLFQTPDPGTVTDLSSDTIYFTCSFAGHCAKGQKVAVYFASAPLPPSPGPSPSESAAADQSPASRPFKFVSEKMGTNRKVSVTMA
ncbi:hypothetical protein M0R45_003163 [Rubus argutus]|uniref:Phytocyanin domain-containing protein n=1 Tax=Rubus argutus TaxID=59490 RepID=A0AAW1YEB2_RUBAR